MASVCGIDCTFTLYVLTFEKQKQGKHNKARIGVDENHHVKAINPPEGWTTAPERLRKSIWSDELDSYMSETFGLNNIRAGMASTEERELYTVVIQCGNKNLSLG